MADFVPPSIDSHEGPAPFVPPPVSAHEGEAGKSDDKPGVMSRYFEATGLPGTYRALFKPADKPGEDPRATFGKNVIDILKGSLEESGGHTTDMMSSAARGDFGSAAGNAIASIPFIGPMIDKLATHLENGEWPEAAGTATTLFGPKALDAAKPIVKGAVDAASETASNARTDLSAAAKAALQKPSASQPVPGTESLPPELAQALALHPKTAALGSVLQRLDNAKGAMEASRGSRLPAQQPIEGHVFGEPTAPLPDQPWNPRQFAPADIPEVPSRVSLLDASDMSPDQVKALAQERLVQNRSASNDFMQRQEAAAQKAQGDAKAAALTRQATRVQAVSSTIPGESPAIDAGESAIGDKIEAARQEQADGIAGRSVAARTVDRIKALSADEPPATVEVAKEPSVPPATLKEAATDPIQARRNALRDVKTDKVVNHLLDKGFDPSHLELISPRQWSAVAQSSGVNELQPNQIADVISKFKEKYQ